MARPRKSRLTFHEVIDLCTRVEEEAVAFYDVLASRVDDPVSRRRFEELADIEKQHVSRFRNMNAEDFISVEPGRKVLLNPRLFNNISDPGAESSTTKLLLMAARREAATLALYEALAEQYKNEPLLSGFFTMMAEDEAQHQHDLESEYELRQLGTVTE